MIELKDMPDSEIDFSDIPELTEKFWKNAMRNPLLRRKKTPADGEIDSDMVVACE